MALTKVTSGGLTDDSIVNADINSSAAVALSKLATDPSNATNLASGTVPTARLGSGTASSSTVLYGDQTYKAEPTGGKIGQVLQGTRSSTLTVGSGTYATLGVPTSITPVATSSKVLIMVTLPCNNKSGTDAEGMNAQIYKDGSALKKFGGNVFYQGATDAVVQSVSYNFLDSPSTTSAVEYNVFVARAGSSDIEINTNATNCSITLMEVLA